MGLLDQALGGVLGGALGGRSRERGRSPIVNAVLLALAAKALQHYLSHRRQTQAGGGAPAKSRRRNRQPASGTSSADC